MSDSATPKSGSAQQGPLAFLRSLSLSARAGLAQAAGLTFAGKRDLNTALGYQTKLEAKDYRERYERNCIAGRVVDALPKATWRGGGEVIEDQDPDVLTPFEDAWQRLDQRLKIWPIFQRADTLAGIGEYSVILLGAPGELSAPIIRLPEEQLLYLTPFSQADAKVHTYVEDQKDPRFGQPLIYKIGRLTPKAIGGDKDVHWSRVLHIADGLLDDHVTGTPRLKRIWNRLDDLDKVTGGGAEAFWHNAYKGYHLELDPEVKWEPNEEQRVKEEVDEYMHGMRRFVRTRGVEMKALGSDVADFNSPADAILVQISAGTGIPHRILTGSERGELASSQDRNNWNERVNDRRLEFAGPQVVRAFVDRLIEFGTLPAPVEYEVVWPQVSDLDEGERAALAVKYAEVNQKAGETVIIVDEIRVKALGLAPIADVQGETTGDEQADDEEEIPRAAASSRAPWRAVHKAADSNRDRVRKTITSAFAQARAQVTLESLATPFEHDDSEAAAQVMLDAIDRAAATLQKTLPDRLLATLAAGGQAAAKSAQETGSFTSPRVAAIGQGFDATNPHAVAWARNHSSRLIIEITEETRAAVRAVIAEAFEEGIPPREAAKLLRPLIGLTQRQAAAVMRVRKELLDSVGGGIVRAGKIRVRVPESGASQDLIDRATSAYADRLHKHRSLLIARTETLAASNEGQRQLWEQAVKRGDLTGRELREWIFTPDERACPECSAMNGQLRGLAEPFVSPTGQSVMVPPLHPACRCVTGISAQTTRKASAA